MLKLAFRRSPCRTACTLDPLKLRSPAKAQIYKLKSISERFIHHFHFAYFVRQTRIVYHISCMWELMSDVKSWNAGDGSCPLKARITLNWS